MELANVEKRAGSSEKYQKRTQSNFGVPPFVRWPDGFQCQSSKKQSHLGEGIRTQIVLPADPPTPLPLCDGSALRLKNCPVAVEFRSIGEALHRRNCQVYDAWRARGASPNLLILRVRRAQTVKQTIVL